ncbi:hypothetical protein CCR96_10775 [Halochromatium roseum]|nr:hypothetical protein [Halochromatium roseum]
MAIDRAGEPIAIAKAEFLALHANQASQANGGGNQTNSRGRISCATEQDPEHWWQAVIEVLSQLCCDLGRYRPQRLCVDATSATLLLCTLQGKPLTPALMYNDARAVDEAKIVAERAPNDSPAQGPSASLAKLLSLRRQLDPDQPALALHQADWISGRLRGQFGDSDWNNALKLGFDPHRRAYPPWLLALDLKPVELPRCHPPGVNLGPVSVAVATATGLAPTLRIAAGTTDSTAATLAAGARAPGDAVTSLGSTLVLKLVSTRAVTDAASGVYSHRVGDLWLVGGASNSGGAVLRRFFDDTQLSRLSERIDPTWSTGLDYYPLPHRGERFPIANPDLAPRITPRPVDDSLFLAGLFEGIAQIERTGYQRLGALGAPTPRRILSSGGGAQNPVWSAIRSRILGLPVECARQQEAAYGAALLARGDWGAAARPDDNDQLRGRLTR